MFYPNSKLFVNSPSNDSYDVKKYFTLIVNSLTTLLVMIPTGWSLTASAIQHCKYGTLLKSSSLSAKTEAEI